MIEPMNAPNIQAVFPTAAVPPMFITDSEGAARVAGRPGERMPDLLLTSTAHSQPGSSSFLRAGRNCPGLRHSGSAFAHPGALGTSCVVRRPS